MNNIIIITGVILLIVAAFFIYIRFNLRPIGREKARKRIESLLENVLESGMNLSDVQVLIESGEKGFSEKFVYSKKEAVDRPFHIASVGKIFTATLMAILQEEGNLNFDDPVSDYLDDHLLENLFVYKGKDYKDQVTIHHLLSHTSGVADYFEDKAIDTENMKMLILKEKDRIWKPEDLIHFTQNHQKAVSRPGERYHYSDTGYILLGLLVERISGCSFATMLHEKIFSPLQMKDSYLMFYSQPESGNNLLNDIWFAGHEISNWNSLSIDWAGGGIVSTLDDLKVFIRALNHYEIISEKTLKEMYVFKHKFVTGLYYGLGFMEYRFRDYSPTLGFLPSLRGHMGVLGTQVFYDKNSDTTVIMNLGSTDYTSKGVRLLIQILANVFRISVNSSLTAEDSE